MMTPIQTPEGGTSTKKSQVEHVSSEIINTELTYLTELKRFVDIVRTVLQDDPALKNPILANSSQ